MSINRFLRKLRWPVLGGLLTLILLAAYIMPAVQKVRMAAARSADA